MNKERKTARQILTDTPRDVISVDPDDSVLAALGLMAEKDISTVLVMQGGKLAASFPSATMRARWNWLAAMRAASRSARS